MERGPKDWSEARVEAAAGLGYPVLVGSEAPIA
jgi:hypothetical protein